MVEQANPFEAGEQQKAQFRKCLVALVGLPLVGKSTLGRKLASRSNFTYLDVDEARWEIFLPSERLPTNQEAFVMQTAYQKNHEKARDLLEENSPVILGATYSRDLYHEMLKWLAEKTKTPLVVFLLDTTEEEIAERINTRQKIGSASTIKTIADFQDVKSRYQPIQGVDLTTIDTGLPIDDSISRILSKLDNFRIK